MKTLIIVVLALILCGCGKQTSSSQENNDSTNLSKAQLNLLTAQQNFQMDSSEANYIWLGRRLAYLNQLDEAIQVYSKGLIRFPSSYKIRRHRGHRYISLRKFNEALIDLTAAGAMMAGKPIEVEPDGIPNKINQPLSSVQFNVWYHLALVYYLKGQYSTALEKYQLCLEVSDNDDLVVATTDWCYMSLRRMGKKEDAERLLQHITDTMNIIENDSYYKRLKMYQRKLPPDSLLSYDPAEENYDLNLATQGYGVGNWYLYNGDTARATEIFKKVVSGKSKSAFGFIAAEVDLALLNKKEPQE